jgi:type 1 glutamine amidotransferase
MKNFILVILLLCAAVLLKGNEPKGPVRLLVITGGHGYEKEPFNEMLSSLGPEISFEIAELPSAYEMFKPENRNRYDVLVFYHMFQTISTEQQADLAGCIRDGKPVVALHHSICAYDNWEEYWRIIGGKYFHKTTVFNGTEYKPGTYIHDLNFRALIADKKHPVTRGVDDFDLLDETYQGYWVDPSARVLVTTSEKSSTPVIGWAKKYGKAKIVVLQSGHDRHTFSNSSFRKLLKQSVEWVVK